MLSVAPSPHSPVNFFAGKSTSTWITGHVAKFVSAVLHIPSTSQAISSLGLPKLHLPPVAAKAWRQGLPQHQAKYFAQNLKAGGFWSDFINLLPTWKSSFLFASTIPLLALLQEELGVYKHPSLAQPKPGLLSLPEMGALFMICIATSIKTSSARQGETFIFP